MKLYVKMYIEVAIGLWFKLLKFMFKCIEIVIGLGLRLLEVIWASSYHCGLGLCKPNTGLGKGYHKR